MNRESRFLTISYMNIHGQTKLPTVKQLQIEDFVKFNKIDILHMQECDIDEDTFSTCNFISSNFNLTSNNSQNKLGLSCAKLRFSCASQLSFDGRQLNSDS